eukprot:Rhum_TRINITY_DN13098_c0_g1::Rhum_TRINITY_DN13098_c0_g1_i1::g.56949::m.56949
MYSDARQKSSAVSIRAEPHIFMAVLRPLRSDRFKPAKGTDEASDGTRFAFAFAPEGPEEKKAREEGVVEVVEGWKRSRPRTQHRDCKPRSICSFFFALLQRRGGATNKKTPSASFFYLQ